MGRRSLHHTDQLELQDQWWNNMILQYMVGNL